MNTIVEYHKGIVEGEKKLQANDFLKDLSALMENEQFVTFFKKHMSSWLDIKCSITYMHLYRKFKDKYKDLNNDELDNRLIVYLLSKIMRDNKLRPWSINAIDEMLQNKKVDFFKEFEAIMIADNEQKFLKQ
jgi:hypothetical protein